MLVTLAIFVVGSFAFSTIFLNPDYEPYERVFDLGALNYEFANTELAFVWLVQAAEALGLDYEQFRAASLLCCATLLAVSFIVVDAWAAKILAEDTAIALSVVGKALVAVALFIFLFEFLQVRIRAGLSVSLLSLAFATQLTAPVRGFANRSLLTAALVALAYGIHGSTTLVLGYLLFAPFMYGYILSKVRPLLSSMEQRAFVFGLLMVISLLIIFFVFTRSVERGENLDSPLNVVRFLCIGVAPLILVLTPYLWTYPREMGPAAKADAWRLAAVRRLMSWMRLSSASYLCLACALVAFYASGFITTSGEAVVRVFTLSSVPGLFAVLVGSKNHRALWIYLVVVNALFFVNSLLAGFN